jgi:hypothetical protein
VVRSLRPHEAGQRTGVKSVGAAAEGIVEFLKKDSCEG